MKPPLEPMNPRQPTPHRKRLVMLAALALMNVASRAETVALWLFDEQAGVHPNSVLNDAGPHRHFLILGRGAELVPGRFGNALRPVEPPPLAITYRGSTEGGGGVAFGLRPPPSKPGRTQPPLRWENAPFAARFTNGDAHLGRAPFANATDSKLNLGENDWTVEAWLRLDAAAKNEGVIFEIGAGPRGENDLLTRFTVLPAENAFAFTGISTRPPPRSLVAPKRIEFPNPAGPPAGVAHVQTITLALREPALPRDTWLHVALVHVAATGELRLFLDGKVCAGAAASLDALPHGDEAYVSVGRDGKWGRPFPGAIDELRISDHAVYPADFAPPGSFSKMHGHVLHRAPPMAGPPLLFAPGARTERVVELGSRLHLCLDDALQFATR